MFCLKKSPHSCYLLTLVINLLDIPIFLKLAPSLSLLPPGLGWKWAARGQECGRRTGAVLVGMGQELGLGPAAAGAEQYGHSYRKQQGGNLIV